ncbi:MAG: MFS transporter [Reyranella sp.]|uniref:MFS transporter n=1 Tax=Reyranella sp. TaxID=1929291 RepID=UPI001AD4E914|nr:MFS transporter [Reyranella sp.]MBN9087964.1 MFS transporter [Reyranella sp.]
MAADTDREHQPAVSRLMLFFAIVYVVEGIGQARVGIILQPLTSFLKLEGWTPLQVTAYFGALNLPWVIKPVFGLVSDFVPLFGYRRTSYLILASTCAAVGYAGIALLERPSEFALFLLLTSYAMATASTLCGALLAENARTFQQSSLFVGQQWLWFYVAIMLSAFVGGELVEHLSASAALTAAAAVAAVAPIAVILATPLLLEEARSKVDRETFRVTLTGIVAALRSRPLWLVAAFLFLYAFAPGFGTPLYYYMTDRLQFSQTYIGTLGSIAAAGWIAGALLHRWLLRRMSAGPLLCLSIVLGTASAASFLLLTDETSAAIVNFANGLAQMIATIASLTLAAQHCPRRAEGFAFAGLMSVSNLADICSINVGAFLYEHVFDSRLAPLIVVSAATTAVAAVLVPWLARRRLP